MNVDFRSELEQAIADIGLQIKQTCPSVKRVFIEAETWNSLTAKHQLQLSVYSELNASQLKVLNCCGCA
ncbi:MAG: hypothetical protein COB62_07800 [Piscirickettsiaceae bacterium]|nr:MAG: hypothetical protein COB62_07800 [Piscirickettsiaceae bacterium]